MRVFLLIGIWLCTLLLSTPVHASESVPVDTGKVVAQLVTSHDRIAPGQDYHIALSIVTDPEWHTYWKNPGDSGEPVDIHWSVTDMLTFGDIVWPLPDTIPTGPIVNYGFSDRILFPVPVKLTTDVTAGALIPVEAEVSYLVCKDICIPEAATLSVFVEVGNPQIDNRWDFNIDKALKEAPRLSTDQAQLKFSGGRLQIDIAGDYTNLEQAYFFADTTGYIAHSDPQTLIRAEKGLRLDITPGFLLQDGLNGDIRGVLRTETGPDEIQGVWLTASPAAQVDIGKTVSPVPASTNALTLWGALIGAFVGGLILNLMPCVFPVIAMKALSFARHAHEERSRIRHQGTMYTFGVLLSFLALTAVLLALKATGAAIGWGFQLQNPVVNALLALLFFGIGLNLLGVFNINPGVENVGVGLISGTGSGGAFFTGILAVIVATPCTAPFMAVAISFALVQPAFVTIIVFLALGFGFALPFFALTHWPNLLSRLPKPGPWMETFKQVLAFFMFAVAIWLVWVLSFQTSENGVAKALTAMLALAFAVFALKKPDNLFRFSGGASIIVALALVTSLHTTKLGMKTPAHTEWSPEITRQLRAEGKAVFVDFTAAWCVTCKVNETFVLNGAADLFEKYNTELLVADWTNKNEVLAAELAKHGRAGVPLYLLYPSGHNFVKPAILPQILTRSVLEKALDENFNPGESL